MYDDDDDDSMMMMITILDYTPSLCGAVVRRCSASAGMPSWPMPCIKKASGQCHRPRAFKKEILGPGALLDIKPKPL